MKCKLPGVTHHSKAVMTGKYAEGGRVRETPNDGAVSSVTETEAGDYPTFRKSQPEAGGFKSAFAAARKAGQDSFTWQGRKYTTEVAKPAPKPRGSEADRKGRAEAPKTSSKAVEADDETPGMDDMESSSQNRGY